MNTLVHITRVSDEQASFCESIGVSVWGDTIGLARAKLDDHIDRCFNGATDLGRPTLKQIELANKFGNDISSCTRREGNAIISDIMVELNMVSIEDQGLTPGVSVVNKWDTLDRIEVISSIQEDGLVFLKGGNGKRAWARNLVRISE